jgi:hypothetical protein
MPASSFLSHEAPAFQVAPVPAYHMAFLREVSLVAAFGEIARHVRLGAGADLVRRRVHQRLAGQEGETRLDQR